MDRVKVEQIIEKVFELMRKRLEENDELMKRRMEENIELMRKRMEENIELMKKRTDEELELAKQTITGKIKSFFNEENHTPPRTDMKLKFMNKICPEILTSQEIKGEGDTPVEIALVDSTGNVVSAGPEASVIVKIVLLNEEAEQDDWTVEEFNANIVPEIQGKLPLLVGNVLLKLQSGVAIVDKIKLRNHASEIKPPVFKLGARVTGASYGDRIKEAKTESFTVKTYRKQYFIKHESPSLSDEVSRLVNIGKGGLISRRLQDNQINNVEDFLIKNLINPQGLKKIVNLRGKKWDAVLNNALKCSTDKRVYCYINSEQKMGIIFNVLGQALGLYYQNQFAPMMPEKDETEVAKVLLESAYKNWGNVRPFDDMNSLQQHLNACGYKNTMTSEMVVETSSRYPDGSLHNVGSNMEPSDSVMPYYPEIVGELRSRRSNMSSFRSVSSTMNSSRELTGGEDFSSFGIDDVEKIVRDIVPHSPPFNFEILYQDFDNFLQQNDGCNMQHDGLVNESNGDESEVVQTSIFPKRWMKLLSVLKWFLISKRVSGDVTGSLRKKQKIH